MAMPVTYCTIDGCGKRNHARGMCSAHYNRFIRHGSPDTKLRAANGECIAWLEEHAAHAGEECLEWPFAKCGGRGYVEFRGGMTTAGRAMCVIAWGEPPTPDYEAAHSCGKGHEGCVNPRHLSWKTCAENHADKLIHGTDSRGEKHAQAILTEASVERIILKQESAATLALELGVRKGTIYAVRAGKNWRHVHDRLGV
jgi:hypothetical protein